MNRETIYLIIIFILLIIILGLFVYMDSQIIEYNDVICLNCVNEYLEKLYSNFNMSSIQ